MNASGHLRRAIRAHPHLADAATALVVFAATMITAFAGHQAASVNAAIAIPVAVLACGVLAVRRHLPLGALAVSAIGAELFLAETTTTDNVLILLAPAIALYTVADLVERRRGLTIAACALAALIAAHVLIRSGHLGPQNLALAALGALAIAAGDSARNRRAYLTELEQRTERAESDRELAAHRRVAEERLRIARDLHDSVGHHLALIGVQSEVAGRAIDRDGPAAREALVHVKSASRTALQELSDTVSLLRQPGDPVITVEIPALGLDRLDELIETMRTSGLVIDCQTDGTSVPLSPAVGFTAYRVIQESLTNVRKHSGTRRVRLTVEYEPHAVRITVDNLGAAVAERGHQSADPVGGHGIAGMRERVLALGGNFTAGPDRSGSFRVAAALPYQTTGLSGERVL
jgi:signal transduction histidine kinase